MTISEHRYRQSRQGASITSSRWVKAGIVASVVTLNLLFALVLWMLQESF